MFAHAHLFVKNAGVSKLVVNLLIVLSKVCVHDVSIEW